MNDRRDLELVLESGTPLIVIETTDETRVLDLLREIALARSAGAYRPLFRWSITDGLQRLDLDLEAQRHNAEPEEALRHIRAVAKPGIYALLDFHPFLNEPVHVRLLKDIALAATDTKITLLLIGHRLDVPHELGGHTARFSLRLPDAQDRRAIVERCATEYANENGRRVNVDEAALELLIQNLAGLTAADTERLARNAIRDDGAVTASDVPAVMKAKYQLLNRGGVLSFEYETTRLAELAGFRNLKQWLKQRACGISARPAAWARTTERDSAARRAGLREKPSSQSDSRCVRSAPVALGFRLALQQVSRGDRAQLARVAANSRGLEPMCALAGRDRERTGHRRS